MFSHKFTLFSLFGFKVSVDASWLVIALLLVWSLAVALFPATYPSLSAGIYVLMAVIGTLGFFLSIVIHEFCHALVARLFGLQMRGITLWMLGGVAEMSEEPQSAKAEFWMAAAGPGASIVITLACYALFRAGEAASWSIIAVGIFNYLWRVNLILIIFNLIPAFPLDGGRILRSLLWAMKGRLNWATRIASLIGAGFGILLMMLAVVQLLTGDFIGAIWYFLIGAFIRWAAKSSYTQLLVRESLAGGTVGQLVRGRPAIVSSSRTVGDLVEDFVYPYHQKVFPVADAEGHLVGCVRAARVNEVPRADWGRVQVQSLMEPCGANATISADQPATAALDQLMRAGGAGHLIVVRDGQVLGALGLDDILRYGALIQDLAHRRRPSATDALRLHGQGT